MQISISLLLVVVLSFHFPLIQKDLVHLSPCCFQLCTYTLPQSKQQILQPALNRTQRPGGCHKMLCVQVDCLAFTLTYLLTLLELVIQVILFLFQCEVVFTVGRIFCYYIYYILGIITYIENVVCKVIFTAYLYGTNTLQKTCIYKCTRIQVPVHIDIHATHYTRVTQKRTGAQLLSLDNIFFVNCHYCNMIKKYHY